MKVSIDVKPENIIRRTTDGRGRITLGSEYADTDVRLAIVEIDPNEDDD